MNTWMQFLLVGIGGATGSMARFAIGEFARNRLNLDFPVGTFLVNTSGCLVIGFLAAAFYTKVGYVPDNARILFLAGVLGGYTTFSSYIMEGNTLLDSGKWNLGLAYLLSTLVIGMASYRIGEKIATSLFGAGH